MIMTAIFFGGMTALLTIAAFACGESHNVSLTIPQHIQETFAPKNWREFVLPPCPICWAARATALVAITVVAFRVVGGVTA